MTEPTKNEGLMGQVDALASALEPWAGFLTEEEGPNGETSAIEAATLVLDRIREAQANSMPIRYMTGMTPKPRFVLQDWVGDLTFMQQSVLLTAVRGPDGLPKYHPVKLLIRWYRRAILRSSFLGETISNPRKDDGGSFLGASLFDGEPEKSGWYMGMDKVLGDYIATLDEIPHHFQLHLLHSLEIVGYKHPDLVIREWFNDAYVRLVRDMHLYPETEAQLDHRLGDSREGWLAHADDATIA